MGYYSVGSKGKQIKGGFPARGYCIDCFLGLAKRKGMLRVEREALREKLVGRSVSPGRRK